jgi:hypothetical protein
MNTEYDWSPSQMLEIQLTTPDDFLKIAETLTRIGISNSKAKILYQTCHILHKRGRYFIVGFKELFALDGRRHTITVSDIKRRNLIASLLQEWKMCTILDEDFYINRECIQNVHIIRHSDKINWILSPKYKIGN